MNLKHIPSFDQHIAQLSEFFAAWVIGTYYNQLRELYADGFSIEECIEFVIYQLTEADVTETSWV